MRTKTIELKGKKYAQVKDRLHEFREKNPNGLIETTPLPQTDGTLIFKARILVNKGDPASAEATGHAYSLAEKISGEKAFEKLETIAVGRALALLGYATDGEIASSEEMEEFTALQEQKKEEMLFHAQEKLEECKSLDELKAAWSSLPVEAKEAEGIVKLKDAIKEKLSAAPATRAPRKPKVEAPAEEKPAEAA